jgi:hypothetical protein
MTANSVRRQRRQFRRARPPPPSSSLAELLVSAQPCGIESTAWGTAGEMSVGATRGGVDRRRRTFRCSCLRRAGTPIFFSRRMPRWPNARGQTMGAAYGFAFNENGGPVPPLPWPGRVPSKFAERPRRATIRTRFVSGLVARDRSLGQVTANQDVFTNGVVVGGGSSTPAFRRHGGLLQGSAPRRSIQPATPTGIVAGNPGTWDRLRRSRRDPVATLFSVAGRAYTHP